MAGCITTGICPMRLTSIVNGVYYYDCLNCVSGVSQGSIGAHDTQSHRTGVGCNCILQPIAHKPDAARQASRAAQHGSAKRADDSEDVEVVCLGQAEATGLQQGITFDTTTFPGDPALAIASTSDFSVDVAHLGDSDRMWRVDYHLRGLPAIAARLLTISITWLDVNTGASVTRILRVGQELDDPSEMADYDRVKVDTSASMRVNSFSHQITLQGIGDIHYILLKTAT